MREEATLRSQVYEHVWWLSEVFGPRVTGTPAFAQASEWAMQKFREWGLANVHQERWAFGQGWTINRFSATMLEPQPAVLIGAPRNYSPVDRRHRGERGRGGAHRQRGRLRQLRRPAARQDRGDAAGARRAHAGGAGDPPDGRRPVVDRSVHAGGAGAGSGAIGGSRRGGQGAPAAGRGDRSGSWSTKASAALLERGSDDDLSAGGSDLSWETQRTDGGTIFPTSGGSRNPKAAPQVPSATLAVEHYNRLVRLLDRKVPVRMEVSIQTTFHPEGVEPNGINTIAEIPGSDLAHEVVIVGAHMDGVPYATGATDNATGTAAMMEAVRAIQALKLRPRRTIRIALWGGEEQGLLGSRAYVAQHYRDPATGALKPAHGTVAAYFNLDNGTGRIRGIWGQANKAALPILDRWGEPLKPLGWRMASPRIVSATDHTAFEEAGLPGFQFIQERLEYNSRSHHSNMDTFDRVQKADAEQQGVVAAIFAWSAANWPEKLPRKPPAARSTP